MLEEVTFDTVDEVRDYHRSNVLQDIDGLPLFSWLDINPTELCNRTCSFCPRGIDYPNQNLHISPEIIEKLGSDLEELNFKGMINICGNGEPLLCKNLNLLISRLKNFKVELVTNGDALTEEKIYELFDCGLKFINVSLYDGEHQVDEFKKLFSKCGIPPSKYSLREYWEAPKNMTNRAGSINNGKSKSNSPCYYMHYSMELDWNGDILFCCHTLYNKSIINGNILKSSLKEIWYGEKMDKYRKLLVKGRDNYPCNQCDAIGTLFGKKFVEQWGLIKKD